MYGKRSTYFFLIFLLVRVSSEAQVVVDTVMKETDSVRYALDMTLDIPTDPTVIFFQEGKKTKTPGKVILQLKDRKIKSLAAFLKSLGNGEAGEMEYADYAFADLDKDGRQELLVSNFTGGAHCCDEIYIFKNTAPDKYQHVAKLFAGNTLITKERTFVYDFQEQFGYFFTCFACGYEDTTDAGPLPNSTITIRYRKGKMEVIPGNADLKALVRDNLEKLGEQPYQPLEDDIAQDNGLRKEMAFNLAVFYYSFGRNLTETQQLFFRYYKHTDAKKVWAGFARQLRYMRLENDF